MTAPLYILRHGETVWNRSGRMQGQRDSPLTALGRVQAARQGALLRRAGVAVPAFVSPLGRARRSAALAGLRATVDPDLSEIAMGAGEGLPRPPEARPGVLWKFACPGAESQDALIARLSRVLARPRPAILITHGVLVIGLRAMARGLPPEAWDTLDDPQGVVFVLDGQGERRLG
ncbi:histidine phosphatase family protein [Jannaschia seohaensis]|uniref:Probable phosphoglycerate mutase n=1 Tax=Jannaschia seohaensis TaxID=475081 RepID=A0A2Y9B6U3_9RHOB|nr:histidine phosphatase family protein [Jannaschia seohaensis]PWJ12115.1 putative phosphoglycerate mutase [Jannaschia seohaensis]SSA51218.1 probable phosphoglycerate mutase [Jannaschia seohaensis]